MRISALLRSIMISLCMALLIAATMAWGLPLRGLSTGGSVSPFSSVSLGTMAVYGNGACASGSPPPGFVPPCIFADTFWNTWGAGGVIYNWTADTSYFNAPGGGSNMDLTSLSNFTSSMVGTEINHMTAWGGSNTGGSDDSGCTFKPGTLISLRGTLVGTAQRQCYSGSPFIRSAQLIKSTDNGATFTPAPPSTANPYTSPTFTDLRFVGPAFFQYGQDYQTQSVDRSDSFVYATSTDQNSGLTQNQMFVGRIAIATLANTSITDNTGWQFFQGGDGSLDANWGALSTAVPVCTDSLSTGRLPNAYYGSVQYLPAFGTYLLVSFVMYGGSGGTSSQFFYWQLTHPWGPCTFTASSPVWDSSNPQGPPGAYDFYVPALVQASAATDGGHHMVMLLSANEAINYDFYTMFIVPMTVH